MPQRENSLVNHNIYHIFNKTLDHKKIFLNPHENRHFINILTYYRSSNVRLRFSKYRTLSPRARMEIYQEIFDPDSFIVNILAYCLMPNHFHLLLRQESTGGIAKYMANCINSFTRHVNIKKSRSGPLFLTQFKAMHIVSDEQLKHVSRYIHLNPFSSHLVPVKEELSHYEYSSYPTFLNGARDPLTHDERVMSLFGNDRLRYQKFVMEQADYQEQLEHLKHTYKWR